MSFDDSDMKIAPERISDVFDSSEGAANAFVREKNNGNMEKARGLGKQFANELTVENKGATLFGVGAFDNENTILQRRVVFSFIVSRVVEDMAPNSMVAQSVISSFHESVRDISPEIYDSVTDSAAFSLYALAGRSLSDDAKAIGKVFARLCEREDDVLFVRYGSEIVNYFIMYCTQLVLRAQLVR